MQPTPYDLADIQLMQHMMDPLVSMSAAQADIARHKLISQQQSQDEAQKLILAMQLHGQLQKDQLAGLSANEMAKLAQQEKIKKEELAARDEKMTPVFEDRARLAEELNSANADLDAEKIAKAQSLAIGKLRLDPNASKFTTPGLDLITSLQQKAKANDPKAQALLAQYEMDVQAFAMDKGLAVDPKKNLKVADLSNRIQDIDRAIQHHLIVGGSYIPTYGKPAPYGQQTPATGRLGLDAMNAVAKTGGATAALPQETPQIAGAVTPLLNTLKAAPGNVATDFALQYGRPAAAKISNIWSQLFGGNLIPQDQIYSPEEKALMVNQDRLLRQYMADPNSGVPPAPVIPPTPSIVPGPIVPQTPPELLPAGGYVPPSTYVPDALRPSVIINPNVWGYPRQ